MSISRADDARWGVRPAQIGVWAFLAVVTMLFAAFSSSLLIRRASADWARVALPSVLWVSTVILVASSVSLEIARRSRQSRLSWLTGTVALGTLFLVGQLMGWQALVAAGVYVPTSPHGAFVYIMTGLHGVHLLGGLVFLMVALMRARTEALSESGIGDVQGMLDLCATYWHFMGGLWLYLFVVLSIG